MVNYFQKQSPLILISNYGTRCRFISFLKNFWVRVQNTTATAITHFDFDAVVQQAHFFLFHSLHYLVLYRVTVFTFIVIQEHREWIFFVSLYFYFMRCRVIATTAVTIAIDVDADTVFLFSTMIITDETE